MSICLECRIIYTLTGITNNNFLLLKLSGADNSETGILQQHAHLIIGYKRNYTVNLVIFTCLNFREFLILGLFTKFRIREFIFSVRSAIIIIITITISRPLLQSLRRHRQNQIILSPTNISEGDKLNTFSIVPLILTQVNLMIAIGISEYYQSLTRYIEPGDQYMCEWL